MSVVFVVGQTMAVIDAGQCWDLHGIFTDQSVAESQCLDASYFVGPIHLNERLPIERFDWPGCYYQRGS